MSDIINPFILECWDNDPERILVEYRMMRNGKIVSHVIYHKNTNVVELQPFIKFTLSDYPLIHEAVKQYIKPSKDYKLVG